MYRKNVGIMLINNKGLVFMAKRVTNSYDIGSGKCWQMPQGGIDKNETPEDAVYREMMEEIGTNNVELIATSKAWYNYDFPKEVLLKNPLPFKGQSQKWFLFKFLGKDDEFDFNKYEKEFQDFKWVKPEQVPSLVIEFKSGVYRSVVNEFKPLIIKNHKNILK